MLRPSSAIYVRLAVNGLDELFLNSPSRHFSQGLIFAGSDGAEPAWRVVFRQEVVIEAVRRLRGGTFLVPKLDFPHSSASLLARPQWKSLFG